MARHYTTAGNYGNLIYQKKIDKLLFRSLNVLIILGVLLGLNIGSIASSWIPKSTLTYFNIFLLSLGGLTLFLLHRFKKKFDDLARIYGQSSFNYLKGAMHEELVADKLNSLPDTWHCFHAIQISSHYDLDHVIVSKAGVFALSTKSGQGLIQYNQNEELFLNNRPCDFASKAAGMAANLRNWLNEHGVNCVNFVKPVVVVPLCYVEGKTWVAKVPVLNLESLTKYFVWLNPQLSDEDVTAIVNQLKTLAPELIK